jgi:1-acyl-sn-glycerol-3-phosphate acyltransferase
LRKVIRTINIGEIIGIFPEGTRSPNGELLPGKEGVAKIAILTKVPVVPIGLVGCYDIWPRDKILPALFKKCKINIGEPIYCGGISKNVRKGVYSWVVKKIMNEISKLSNKEYLY